MSGWSGSTKMKLCVALGVCLAGLLVLMTSVKAKKGPLVTDMVSYYTLHRVYYSLKGICYQFIWRVH